MIEAKATLLDTLPGGDLVRQGLADAAAGRMTVPACLVSIARPCLERAGLLLEYSEIMLVPEPEQALYRLLIDEGGDAFGRYNSLLKRLVSFEHSIAHAMARSATAPAARKFRQM